MIAKIDRPISDILRFVCDVRDHQRSKFTGSACNASTEPEEVSCSEISVTWHWDLPQYTMGNQKYRKKWHKHVSECHEEQNVHHIDILRL